MATGPARWFNSYSKSSIIIADSYSAFYYVMLTNQKDTLKIKAKTCVKLTVPYTICYYLIKPHQLRCIPLILIGIYHSNQSMPTQYLFFPLFDGRVCLLQTHAAPLSLSSPFKIIQLVLLTIGS